MESLIELNKSFRGKIKYDEELSAHTTIKTGGIAPLWFVPYDINDLSKFIKLANDEGLKIVVLGNGSNVIIKDGKLDTVFVNLSSSYFKRVYLKQNIITARAGVDLEDLINYCVEKKLSGLEYFTLIPATVGGGVKNNIGVKLNGQIYNLSNFTQRLKLLDIHTNEIRNYTVDELEFGYHISGLMNKIIIEVSFKLEYDNINKIQKRIESIKLYRKNVQDYTLPSCGCVFRNPDGKSAGKLIQDAGLKGKKIGDTMVSTKHGNFIVNCGDAKSEHILKLIKIIQQQVFQHHKIWLETEVEVIG